MVNPLYVFIKRIKLFPPSNSLHKKLINIPKSSIIKKNYLNITSYRPYYTNKILFNEQNSRILIKQPSCFTKTVTYTPFEVKEVQNYGLVDIELINNEVSQWMDVINNDTIDSALAKYKDIMERMGSPKHFETCKMIYEKVNEHFGFHKDFVEIYISFLLRAKMRNLAEILFFELRNQHKIIPSKELYIQIIKVSGQLVSFLLYKCMISILMFY